MTDNKPDETTTDAKSTAQPKQVSSKKKAKKTGRTKSGFLSQLALLSALILAVGIYYLWMQHNELQGSYRQTIVILKKKLADNTQQQNNFARVIEDQLKTLKEAQANLSESFTSLLNTSSHLRNDWLLTEAEYLIKLASHRLLLERDINTAIVALQAADERLREIADPTFIKMRKRLAADITQLRAVPQADITGMSLTLSALIQNIEQLTLATPDPASVIKKSQQETAQRDVENWRELPAAIWKDIKSLVIIRDHATPIQPLLAPEQHFFLTQNLKLKLEQARLALLKSQTEVFRERLAETSKWIQTYFDQKDATTQNTLKLLDELTKQEIKPELPDISATYQALREFRNSLTEKNNKPEQQDKTTNQPEQPPRSVEKPEAVTL